MNPLPEPWQPMETAPKEPVRYELRSEQGPYILIALPGYYMKIGYWDLESKLWFEEQWIPLESYYGVPIAWCPLPEHPVNDDPLIGIPTTFPDYVKHVQQRRKDFYYYGEAPGRSVG